MSLSESSLELDDGEDQMDLYLYLAALAMTIIAIGFATKPLLISYERRSGGFARLPLLAVIGVFGLAIALYAATGRPELLSAPKISAEDGAPDQTASTRSTGGKAASVTALVGGLEARLAESPDDGEGWLLLAKSYDHLGRSADAYGAYRKAAALGVVDNSLGERLGSNAAGESAPEVSVSGRISVDATAAERLDADDTIFVVAGSSDRPMPLAVIRRRAGDLPFDFVLNDANAMVAGHGISSAAKITVSARVSRTGDALNTDPTLSVSTGPFDPRASVALELVLGTNSVDDTARRQSGE